MQITLTINVIPSSLRQLFVCVCVVCVCMCVGIDGRLNTNERPFHSHFHGGS